MAKVTYKRGPSAGVTNENLPIKDGQIIFTTDTNELYLDMPNGNTTVRKQFISGKQLEFEVVQILPVQNIRTNVIYLVPSSSPATYQVYDEYIYTNNSWEKIGNTQVDLSNYYTKAEIDARRVYLTQQEYDALTVIDPNVEYCIWE